MENNKPMTRHHELKPTTTRTTGMFQELQIWRKKTKKNSTPRVNAALILHTTFTRLSNLYRWELQPVHTSFVKLFDNNSRHLKAQMKIGSQRETIDILRGSFFRQFLRWNTYMLKAESETSNYWLQTWTVRPGAVEVRLYRSAETYRRGSDVEFVAVVFYCLQAFEAQCVQRTL